MLNYSFKLKYISGISNEYYLQCDKFLQCPIMYMTNTIHALMCKEAFTVN